MTRRLAGPRRAGRRLPVSTVRVSAESGRWTSGSIASDSAEAALASSSTQQVGRGRAVEQEPERDLVSRSVDDFVNQLRGLADRAMSVASAATGQLPSGLPGLPGPPGALSAAQLSAIMRAISAQRVQLKALTEQFGALDEQLAVLESLLRPVAEWSHTWADLESAATNLIPGRGEQSRGRGEQPRK